MKRAYRSIPSPGDLTPPERDPLTGRRTVRRDDKRHHAHRPGPGIPARETGARGKALVVGAIVVTVLAAAAAFAVNRTGQDSGGNGTKVASAGEVTVPLTEPAPPPTTILASAIEVSYEGGTYRTRRCIPALANTTCDKNEYRADYPIVVRCTLQACATELGDGTKRKMDGPLHVVMDLPYDYRPCGTARLTYDITPQGRATTHGISHPARLTGTVTYQREAHMAGPDHGCDGIDLVYALDAVPR